MVASAFPRISEQTELYTRVLDAADGAPVTFRSLDVGGDKVLPYMKAESEENPALGWRAIRLTLDKPGLLRSQVRALLLAARGRELRLMFPMITDVTEFDRARDLVRREQAFLARQGYDAPATVKLGAMVEVPSILWQLDALTRRVDFLSVGSNDLLQFFFATDRGNAKLAGRFDPLSVPVLSALRSIAAAGARAGVPVTLCGELAASRSKPSRCSASGSARSRCRRPRSGRSSPCCSLSISPSSRPCSIRSSRRANRCRTCGSASPTSPTRAASRFERSRRQAVGPGDAPRGPVGAARRGPSDRRHDRALQGIRGARTGRGQGACADRGAARAGRTDRPRSRSGDACARGGGAAAARRDDRGARRGDAPPAAAARRGGREERHRRGARRHGRR